jgi:hypothetical protein
MTILARTDKKPMTGLDLFNTLLDIKQKTPETLNKPLYMSSDEEGNSMNELYGIETSNRGIKLWPY